METLDVEEDLNLAVWEHNEDDQLAAPLAVPPAITLPVDNSLALVPYVPPGPFQPSKSKGKEKMYANYAFYANGLLSPEAIKILDEGCLKPIAKAFRRTAIDMEEVFDGIFVKGILDSSVR